MQQPNPLEKILNQIAEMVQIVQEAKKNKFAKELPKDLRERLASFEEGVYLFKKLNDDTIKKIGITKEEVDEAHKKAYTPPFPREVKLLERARKLREVIEVMKREAISEKDIQNRRKEVM